MAKTRQENKRLYALMEQVQNEIDSTDITATLQYILSLGRLSDELVQPALGLLSVLDAMDSIEVQRGRTHE